MTSKTNAPQQPLQARPAQALKIKVSQAAPDRRTEYPCSAFVY
jgi:hypothetical protein